MDDSLANAKIGDEVYAPDVSYRPIRYGTIVGQTEKYFVIQTAPEQTIQARKTDGLERGTGSGEGRFASFERRHWYLMTEDRKRMRVLKERTSAIRDLMESLKNRDNYKINSSNIDKAEKLVKELADILKVRKEIDNGKSDI